MDLTLIWKTVLIGVVEGLTEFLPVSSTGHIILAEEVLGFQGPPGKVFEIVARDNSAANQYIQSATLDGKPWTRPWFSQADIAHGGTLVLTMGPKPNRAWGADPADAPPSMSAQGHGHR